MIHHLLNLGQFHLFDRLIRVGQINFGNDPPTVLTNLKANHDAIGVSANNDIGIGHLPSNMHVGEIPPVLIELSVKGEFQLMPDDAVGSITTNEPRHIQLFHRSVSLRQLASHTRRVLLKLFQFSLSLNVNFMTSERFFEHTFRLILRNHDAGTKGTFSSRKIDLRQTLLLKPILSLPNGYPRIDKILSWHGSVEHLKATRPNN